MISVNQKSKVQNICTSTWYKYIDLIENVVNTDPNVKLI